MNFSSKLYILCFNNHNFSKKMLTLLLFSLYFKFTYSIEALDPSTLRRIWDEQGLMRTTSQYDVFPGGNDRCNYYTDEIGYPVVEHDGKYVYAESIENAEFGFQNISYVGVDNPPITKEIADSLIKSFCDDEKIQILSDVTSLSTNGFIGNVKHLVILVRFKDHINRTVPTMTALNSVFNTDTPDVNAPTGSVKTYLKFQSYNLMNVETVFTQWYDINCTESEASTPPYWSELYRILNSIKSSYNWTEFDINNDNETDCLTVAHSGYAKEFGGTDDLGKTSTRVWSHQNWVSNGGERFVFQNVEISRYAMTSVFWGNSGVEPVHIGVIVHELGHVFGLPDLYDFTLPTNGGASCFCIMACAWGQRGNQRDIPSYSPWAKEYLKWIVPIPLSTSDVRELTSYQRTGQVYKLTRNMPDNEYLLIESRIIGALSGMFYDELNQPGIYVWHIDTSDFRKWNTEGGFPGDGFWPVFHNRVRILQADGFWDIEKNNRYNDPKDAYRFPNQILNDFTNPSLLSYQEQMSINCHNTGNELKLFNFNNSGISTFTFVAGPRTSGCLGIPTNRPTMLPTFHPTMVPTFHPTNEPSRRPARTTRPTEAPTAPTNEPSRRPTRTPRPSLEPTAPTNEPSRRPTRTRRPTEAPTAPTNEPSRRPTRSRRPTEAPTAPTIHN
jgi:M6 family metalloprotease-like protein